MALGSFLLAPLADLWGRKPTILGGLVLLVAGMFLSAFAHSVPQLVSWRLLTGLGIGASIAVINSLAAELTNARWRPLAFAVMALGFPIGGAVGGVVAAALLRSHAWPAVFMAGSLSTALLIPLMALVLPEPLAYLVLRKSPDRMERVNALLVRFGHPPVADVPVPPTNKRGYALVFAAGQIGTTLWVVLVQVLFVLAIYFVLTWLPQMVAQAGFSLSTGSVASAVANLAGVGGGLLLGAVTKTSNVEAFTASSMICFGVAIAGLGVTPPLLMPFMIAASVCGFFLYGSAAGFYATLAVSFAAEARASGSGLLLGVGRIASAIAPLAAGRLFAAGLGRTEVSAIFCLCAIAAGIVLLLHSRRAVPVL